MKNFSLETHSLFEMFLWTSLCFSSLENWNVASLPKKAALRFLGAELLCPGD